jgi:hypothetical protein
VNAVVSYVPAVKSPRHLPPPGMFGHLGRDGSGVDVDDADDADDEVGTAVAEVVASVVSPADVELLSDPLGVVLTLDAVLVGAMVAADSESESSPHPAAAATATRTAPITMQFLMGPPPRYQ